MNNPLPALLPAGGWCGWFVPSPTHALSLSFAGLEGLHDGLCGAFEDDSHP